MRILLDTNLLVRAAITPAGLARAILRRVGENANHVLILSPYLLSEVAEVLRRDRIRARWPLTDEEVGLYCRFLAAAGEEVSPRPLAAAIQDPKDQAIVETAVAGSASVLCTIDAHFYAHTVLAFCAAHGIRIMNDVELLRLLKTET